MGQVRSETVTCSSFYRAMPCIRGTSHGPVSVCVRVCMSVSVTSRSPTKTAKHKITQTTQHDSAGTVFFCCQRSPRNSTGVTPYGGAECRWGGSKSVKGHILHQLSKFHKDRSKRYGDIAIFVIFQDGGRRHFGFSKIRNFNDRSAA